jgi:HD superfamily phosphohydrolase
LISSLCLNEAGDGLAITEKGKTAAEMLVFSRYVMFSEVYWHHGVRAATAMLQRAFYLLQGVLDYDALFRLTDGPMEAEMRRAAGAGPAADLLDGLFGPTRKLYKRLAQYNFVEDRAMHGKLARRPYAWLAVCAENFATLASTAIGRVVAPHEILIDAPPVELEVQFQIDVYYPKQKQYRPLGEVSPVVQTLARRQFDDYVKQVRLFAHPRVAEDLRQLSDLPALIGESIEKTSASRER